MNAIKQARLALKWDLMERWWPGTRCACGEDGATDLGHIVYSRHPDSVDLYSPYNMCLLHNTCNTRGESLWINVNACLILLQRAGGPEKWEKWARGLKRKGEFWIPNKMRLAMELWENGIRPFDLEAVREATAQWAG